MRAVYIKHMRQVRVASALLLAAFLLLAEGPGFRNRRLFDEHYAKHGREFGNISQQEYLRLAQALRDAPVGGPILEAVKPGGIATRFDRRNGAFGAYNRDRTIRTFFIPNAGERYFHRQANRPDE
jgi:pyocin large subunit-like protein